MSRSEPPQEKARDWISLAGLRQRGWTAKLVERFLGAPDRTAPNPHYRSAPPMRLWAIERVEAVEQDPRFQQALQEARRRQAGAKQAVERKRELTLAAARTLPLNVQRIPLKQLAKEARLHYFERTGEYPRFEPWGTPDPFRDRLCVNYLRHQASPYDEHLEELSGRVGIRAAYRVLWERIVRAIETAYPELGEEAWRQYRARSALP
ncbi:MAG: hypothetical protein K6T35_07355 [Meiothermus silvanus]|nr:hypothetical protein [Allomeiothermus silvanus]